MLCFGKSHKKILEQAKKDFATGSHPQVTRALLPIVTEHSPAESPFYKEVCELYLKSYVIRMTKMGIDNIDPDVIAKGPIKLIEENHWSINPKLVAELYSLQGKVYYKDAFEEMGWSDPRNIKDAQKHLKEAKAAFKKAKEADSTNAEAEKYTNPHFEGVKFFADAEKAKGAAAVEKYLEAARMFIYEFLSKKEDEYVNTSALGKILQKLATLEDSPKKSEADKLTGAFYAMVGEDVYRKILGTASSFKLEKELVVYSSKDAGKPVEDISADSNKGVDVPSANSSKDVTPTGSPDKSLPGYKSYGEEFHTKNNPMADHTHHHEITVGGQDSYHSDYGHN